MDYYRKRIATHVVSMITQIRRHLHSFPPYLRWLGVSIVRNFQTYRGATQDDVSFVFKSKFIEFTCDRPKLRPRTLHLDPDDGPKYLGYFTLISKSFQLHCLMSGIALFNILSQNENGPSASTHQALTNFVHALYDKPLR